MTIINLYLLDVPENSGIVETAGQDPTLIVDKIGPYFQIGSDHGQITIDRRATGCRHAVWYSAIAGLDGGTVTQLDKDALRVEPNQ